jgi:GTP-binding protein
MALASLARRLAPRVADAASALWTRGLADAPTTSRTPRFVDRVRVTAVGGAGGVGCASHDKSTRHHAPPDGGSGGPGGDVVVEADGAVKSLRGIRPLIKASSGGHGGPSRRGGARGADAVVRVPPGTRVWSLAIPPGAPAVQVADLTAPGDMYVAARGGAGGAGNAGGRRDARGLPSRGAARGAPGAAAALRLELASLADAGLVGPPNAGKSTLLRALTRGAAQPAVGPYPFTTVAPSLGALPPPHPAHDPVIVADVPGLLAGAAGGRGMGHEFLRHVSRCAALALVVDASGAPGVPCPVDQLTSVRAELAAYGGGVEAAAWVAVANKCDAAPDGGASALAALAAAPAAAGAAAVVATSGETGAGVEALAAWLDRLTRGGGGAGSGGSTPDPPARV